MKQWLGRLWNWLDRALDAVERFDFNIRSYFVIFWLAPLLAAFFISVLFVDLRPILRPHVNEIFITVLAGYPLWLFIDTVIARSAKGYAAWRRGVEKAVIAIGSVVIVAGGLIWLAGY